MIASIPLAKQKAEQLLYTLFLTIILCGDDWGTYIELLKRTGKDLLVDGWSTFELK
jgi:hypothetical protein